MLHQKTGFPVINLYKLYISVFEILIITFLEYNIFITNNENDCVVTKELAIIRGISSSNSP